MEMRNKSTILASLIAVLISVTIVAVAVYAATTIGNDVSVGGTLTATGLTTLNGGLTIPSGQALTIAEGALADSTILSADIKDGTIVDADVSSTAAIALSKIQKNIRVGTVDIDPPSIAATTSTTTTVTLTATSTDKIVMIPPSSINAGLIFQGGNVTAENTVTIRLYNYTV